MRLLPDELIAPAVPDLNSALRSTPSPTDADMSICYLELSDLRVASGGILYAPLDARTHTSDRGGLEARAEMLRTPTGDLVADISFTAFPAAFPGFHQRSGGSEPGVPVTEIRVNGKALTQEELAGLRTEILEHAGFDAGMWEGTTEMLRDIARSRGESA